MAINSVTPAHTTANAHASTTQAAKKPAQPFPSMSELMSAGQSAAQNTQATSSTNSTTQVNKI